MNILRYEWKKICFQKGFLGIFFLCAMLNLVFINYAERKSDQSYEPQAYRKMVEDLKEMPLQEAYDKVYEQYQALEELLLQDEVWDEEKAAAYYNYTDNLWAEMDLNKAVLTELEGVLGYDSYLQEIQKTAEDASSISIFQSTSNYSRKNFIKTAEDFTKMETVEPVFDISRGVTMATGFLPTDFFGVFLIFAMCIFLILYEKWNGQYALIAHTVRGRGDTVWNKIKLLGIGAAVIPIVLYMENLLSAYFLYGFGDITRPVQSILEYQSCVLKISIAEYFICFIAVKVVVYFCIGLILMLCCILFQQMISIFCMFSGIWGISLATYYLIPVNSLFAVLKYVNLFYFIQTDKLLMKYQNINIFSEPVQILPAAGITLCILIILAMTGNLFVAVNTSVLWRDSTRSSIFDNKKKKETSYGRRMQKHFKNPFSTQSVTKYEHLKIVKKSGGYIILILFLLVQLFRVESFSYFRIPEQIYYRTYMNYLSGPLTEDKMEYINEENERYEILMQKMQQTEDKLMISQFKEEMLPYTAWEKVIAEHERILNVQENSGKTIYMVYGEGYNQLFGKNKELDGISAVLLNIVLILLLSGVFTCDSGSDMNKIILSTSSGRRDTLRAKKRIACLASIAVFILTYGADVFKVGLKIGMNNLTAPIQSLELFADCTYALNILQYFLLLFAARFFAMYIIVQGILLISLLCKNTARSMLVSSIVFLVPAVLGLLQLDVVKTITYLPLLTANDLLKSWLDRMIQVSDIIIVMAGILMIVISEICMRKRYKEADE